jgi:hypothetical protein
LKAFFSGKAFNNPTAYSDDESCRLRKDINEIFQSIMSIHPVQEKLAVITAGAPGAGKTTKLRQDLEAHSAPDHRFAYVCPDDVCLRGQRRTYGADLEQSNKSLEARQAAYNKWRPGSNAAAHCILANLIREGFAFYFGCTSSGDGTPGFYAFIKSQGYKIRVIHVMAPDQVRWHSVHLSDMSFFHSTEQDVREKGQYIVRRIADTFLTYADQIDFYYRECVEEEAQIAATWIRNASGSESRELSCGGSDKNCQELALGTLQIASLSRYERLKAIHNKVAIEDLQRPDLLWEVTVEKNSKIVVDDM